MKTCKACGLSKPEDDFYFADKKRGYRFGKCKPCHKSKSRQWQVDNPERFKFLTARYQQKLKGLHPVDPNITRSGNWIGASACMLCGHPDNLCWDHNRANGKGRGILCHGCNVGMADIEKNLDWYARAVRYIKTDGGSENKKLL